MKAEIVVEALLENDQIDPKDYVQQVPSDLEEAIAWAIGELHRLYGEGSLNGPRAADEKASELAVDACIEFDLDEEEDYDDIVTPLFQETAKMFKGEW